MSGFIGRAGTKSAGIVGAEGRIGQTCALSMTSGTGSVSGDRYLTGYTTILNTAPEIFTPATNGITIAFSAVYFVKISVYISVKTGNSDNYVQLGLAYNANTRDDRVYQIFSAEGDTGGHRQACFASNVINLTKGRTYGLYSGIQDGSRNINGSTDSMITGITLTYMNEV